MHSLPEILKRDFQKQAPIFLYFFVALNVLGLTRVLLLREFGIRVSTFVAATLGALFISRIVLLAERLPFMAPFPPVPVIYNAAWQTLVYESFAFLVQLLRDTLLAALSQSGPVAAVVPDRLTSPRFWAVQMWIVLLFLIFCTGRSFFRAVGPDRARALLLGPRRRRPRPPHTPGDAKSGFYLTRLFRQTK